MPIALFALTIAAYAIGTTEFVSVGLLPTIANDFHITLPTAGLIVSIYALLATTIATATLATAPWWGHLLYFLLTGLLWVIPAMLVIKWMAGPFNKPDKD